MTLTPFDTTKGRVYYDKDTILPKIRKQLQLGYSRRETARRLKLPYHIVTYYVKNYIPRKDYVQHIADLDQTSRKVLSCIISGAANVTDIARQLDVSRGTVYNRLEVLRKQGLLPPKSDLIGRKLDLKKEVFV